MNVNNEIIRPDGWAKTSGYVDGILAGPGKTLFIAGQVGWDENHNFQSEKLVPQFEQALKNTLAILGKAGGGPEHICRMTCFCTSKEQYLEGRKELGRVWRRLLGNNYPVMSMIFVSDLLASKSLIEIETTAIINDV